MCRISSSWPGVTVEGQRVDDASTLYYSGVDNTDDRSRGGCVFRPRALVAGAAVTSARV
jgi:hypothetical protein